MIIHKLLIIVNNIVNLSRRLGDVGEEGELPQQLIGRQEESGAEEERKQEGTVGPMVWGRHQSLDQGL